jgi:hypothetical protein
VPCLLEGVDRAHLTAIIGLLVIVLQSSFPQSARAEEPPQPPLATLGGPVQPRFSLRLRHSDALVLGTEGMHAVQRAEISAPPIPRECKPSYMAGPAVGVPLGLGAFMGGVVTVTVGNFDLFEPDPKTRRDRALIAGGSIFTRVTSDGRKTSIPCSSSKIASSGSAIDSPVSLRPQVREERATV